MDSQAKWCSKSLVESSLENSKIGKIFEQDRISKYLKNLKFLRPDESKGADETYVFDISFGDLFSDDEKKLDGDNIITEEKKKEILEEMSKTQTLSDAAKAALMSEKELKVIKSENIEEYYNRVVKEFESNTLLSHIHQRNRNLEETELKLVNEILEYEKSSRRNEMKADAETYKKFEMQEINKKKALIQTMTAETRIVEPTEIIIPAIETLYTPNDLSGSTKTKLDNHDIEILNDDDMF